MSVIAQQMLTGLTRPALQQIGNHRLQPAAAAAFFLMQQAAAAEGINITIASSYRDFATQLRIWQGKLSGQRPVFDLNAQLIDLSQLDDRTKLYAILHFSALPGTSRHHWGTDFDVFDSAAISSDYQLQLTPAEYTADGPFHRLDSWLGKHAARFGFFRPYRQYLGGVAVEPWHLSYWPQAKHYQSALTKELVLFACKNADLFPQDLLKTEIDEIMRRYVFNICEGTNE